MIVFQDDSPVGIVSCELLSLWLDFRVLCFSLGIFFFWHDFHVGLLSCVMIFLWPHSSVGRLCGGMMCLWDVLSVGWFSFGFMEGSNCRFVRYFCCTSFVMLQPNESGEHWSQVTLTQIWFRSLECNMCITCDHDQILWCRSDELHRYTPLSLPRHYMQHIFHSLAGVTSSTDVVGLWCTWHEILAHPLIVHYVIFETCSCSSRI